jgi:phage terminase large subunit
MKLRVTPVFEKLWDAWHDDKYKIIVSQGGTRSSKTYSSCQLFAVLQNQYPNRGDVTSIVRKTLPALKSTVMRDYIEILQNHGWYDENNHNKTENIIKVAGNYLEYFSVDDGQKIRGRKRKDLFCNEANELRYDDMKQLMFRTTGKILLDYNPSDEYHWIYDKILPRNDCFFIKSTYLDNPFLSKDIITEIERLKEEDENYWRVYGLGERGSSGATIYTNWELCEEIPQNVDDWVLGLDFGFNVPSSLVLCAFKENNCFIKELLYKKNLTNSGLIEELIRIDQENPKLNIRTTEIFADAAEPKSIQEIFNAGFNIKPASKAVKHGIKTVKSYKLHIVKDSENILKEIKFYKFKEDKDGNVLDEPVKFNDHSMDAKRYAIHSRDHERKEIEAIDLDWA